MLSWRTRCSDPMLAQRLPVSITQSYNFVQRRPNVFDVGPTLYKGYANVLCLLGCDNINPTYFQRLIVTAQGIHLEM